MDYSMNEEKWFNDLDRRCRDILDDALKGYPDYLWVNTFHEDDLGEECTTEMSLEFEVQTGSDFGFPIHTYGLACFRYSLTSMDEYPSIYGYFIRDEKQMEFTIEPLYIDTMDKTIWLLELAKEGWYNI